MHSRPPARIVNEAFDPSYKLIEHSSDLERSKLQRNSFPLLQATKSRVNQAPAFEDLKAFTEPKFLRFSAFQWSEPGPRSLAVTFVKENCPLRRVQDAIGNKKPVVSSAQPSVLANERRL